MDILEWLAKDDNWKSVPPNPRVPMPKSYLDVFDFHSIDNFIFVDAVNHTRGGSFGHNNYDKRLQVQRINNLESDFAINPQEAYSNLLDVISDAKNKISQEIFNTDSVLDDLDNF